MWCRSPKAEASKIPIWGIFPESVGRDFQSIGASWIAKALMQALAVLAAGETILVAPEGTRHTRPSMMLKKAWAYPGLPKSGAADLCRWP